MHKKNILFLLPALIIAGLGSVFAFTGENSNLAAPVAAEEDPEPNDIDICRISVDKYNKSDDTSAGSVVNYVVHSQNDINPIADDIKNKYNSVDHNTYYTITTFSFEMDCSLDFTPIVPEETLIRLNGHKYTFPTSHSWYIYYNLTIEGGNGTISSSGKSSGTFYVKNNFDKVTLTLPTWSSVQVLWLDK
mgnify:CR=1 FL=1